MAGESAESSSSSSPSVMRSFFPAGTVFAALLRWDRSALEAFNVCGVLVVCIFWTIRGTTDLL